MSTREHSLCPQCGGCLTCGIHTTGVTCNGTSSTRREAAWHGYTPDVLRSIARIDIGGNAPWLADELMNLAGRLEQEMNGVNTREDGSDGT